MARKTKKSKATGKKSLDTKKKARTVHLHAKIFSADPSGGALTLARLIYRIRKRQGLSQGALADQLGVTRSHICDIEKERKVVSPARAARFARLLGFPEEQFVRLALQAQVEEAGLDLVVDVNAP